MPVSHCQWVAKRTIFHVVKKGVEKGTTRWPTDGTCGRGVGVGEWGTGAHFNLGHVSMVTDGELLSSFLFC